MENNGNTCSHDDKNVLQNENQEIYVPEILKIPFVLSFIFYFSFQLKINILKYDCKSTWISSL